MAIGAVYAGIHLVSSGNCTGTVRLQVAASPDIAPVVTAAVARWIKTSPRVQNECVAVDIAAVQSADAAVTIAGDHGVQVKGLGQADGRTQVPHVWIPDSSIWLQRMRATRDDIVPDSAIPLARSPLVLGVPEITAKSLSWLDSTVPWATVLQRLNTDIKVHPGIVDPNRDASGTAALVAIAAAKDSLGTQGDQLTMNAFKALLGGESELQSALLLNFPRQPDARSMSTALTLAPMSEQAALSYDATSPSVPLSLIYPEPAGPALDYPFTILPHLSSDRESAAEAMQAVLTGPDLRNLLATVQLRSSDGTLGAGLTLGPRAPTGAAGGPVPTPDAINAALKTWTELT